MEKITPVSHGELWRIKRAAMTDYDYIKNKVLAGEMEFFKVGECYFVTCLNFTPYPELVMVCAQGKGIKNAMDAIRKKAKSNNYKTVRIHAFSKGMKRLLNKNGYNWQECETVYKLEV